MGRICRTNQKTMKTIKAISLLGWVLAAGTLAAQNPKVDSLLHALETNPTADRAEMLWGVAYELYDVDNATALELLPACIRPGPPERRQPAAC